MKSKKTKNLQRKLQWTAQRERKWREQSEMRQFVMMARARQEAGSGRSDLPADPLGFALGSNLITQAHYEVGRLFERLQTRIFGKPHPKTASVEQKKPTTQNVESPIDLEDKARLDRMVTELETIGRLSIVRDVCFYHRWRRDWGELREGLQAISN